MYREQHCIANLNAHFLFTSMHFGRWFYPKLLTLQASNAFDQFIIWESNPWPWCWQRHALTERQEYNPNDHDFETLHMWLSLNVKVSQKSPKGSRWRYFSHNYALLVWSYAFPERAGPRRLQRVVRESQASFWPILKHSEMAKRTYPTALDIISHATMPNEPNQS